MEILRMDENDFCKVVHKTHFCIQSMPVKSRDKGRGLQFISRFGGAKRQESSAPLWKVMIFPARRLFLSALPAAAVLVPAIPIWSSLPVALTGWMDGG